MNAVEIYERTVWDLEHDKITCGEFDEITKPLEDVIPVEWIKQYMETHNLGSMLEDWRKWENERND